ncbi:MAG: nucleotide sugar dehydrogenase [Bacteriovoracaceae bacterium]|jgi:UDP-N-acetyl-D-mannosaminuronic acid dehydrogenase|nr:nucleotide sugar dehydrogenase [Bacteriovoracaceae bacterium]
MLRERLRIAVIGGGGHVGLPLSLVLAEEGYQVTVIDIDETRLQDLRENKFPFLERGGEELLHKTKEFDIQYTSDFSTISNQEVIIFTVGTPVDEHLNPSYNALYSALDTIKPHIRNGQTFIMRSTLFPGTSDRIKALLKKDGFDVGVSFCPERIAQGYAIEEIRSLPQIISGDSEKSVAIAKQIFGKIASSVVEVSIEEAEIAKLFTNTWRYIKFSIANQFYMLAEEKGLDFGKIHNAITYNYPRANDFPKAGFAAGPCLFKDTMQLAAYSRNNFHLGHSAMLINEGLPNFLVEKAKKITSLEGKNVGILGMAFKPNNDDFRESLAYKLKRLLEYENAEVYCTDVYIKDPRFVNLNEMMERCDVIFVGCPHNEYRELNMTGKLLVDCWDTFPQK